MLEIQMDTPISRELEEIGDFGTAEEGLGDGASFAARLSDRPIAFRLRDLAADAQIQLRSELYERFEVWLVPQRLSIIRRKGLAEPVSVGIEVQYDTLGATCSVASLLPAPEYMRIGDIEAAISCSGRFAATGDITPESGKPFDAEASRRGMLGFGATATGELGFAWQASVSVARVQAVGVGSSWGEWRFDRQKQPLYGRDIETWTALVLPKRRRSLEMKARFYYIARTLFVPTRRSSEWVPIACELA